MGLWDVKMHSEQLTLGELRDALKDVNPDAGVTFDFCRLVPTDFRSYRGYYEQIALGWVEYYQGGGKGCTAKDLLEEIAKTIGGTFEGYKGGSYTMSEKTPVWIDNTGSYSGTALIGVEKEEGMEGVYAVTLVTKKVE